MGLYDKAFEYFEKACQIDLGTNMESSVKGTHMAGFGGVWNTVVEGFGGVRITEKGLRVEPHLPSTWRSLKYSINWQGVKAEVYVTHTYFYVLTDGKIKFIYHQHEYQVEPKEKLVIEL